jgi:toxin ParE1/3/4
VNSGYRVAAAAEKDLDNIWDYLADKNLGAAARFLQKVGKTLSLLASNPQMGRPRFELLENLRSFPMGKYVVFYRPVEEDDVSVEIVRILHGARDIPALFE